MSVVLSAQDSNAIIVAAEMIAHGKLVITPTDSGYAVAAALSDESILRLYLAKNRPPDKTTPILVASLEALNLVVQPLLPPVRRLAETFWPGPLTLLLPKANGLPQRVSKLPTVAVRIPDHAVACAFLDAAGGALAVTKATIAEHAIPRTAQEAAALFGDNVSAVLDDGMTEVDTLSTVAEVDGRQLRIVRQGPITEAELRKALND